MVVVSSWSSSSCTCTLRLLLSRRSRFVTVGTIVAAASSRSTRDSTTESAGVARSSIFMENRGPWGPCAARGITVPGDATTLVREFWFRSLRPAPRREAPCAHALTHASSSRSISFSLALSRSRRGPSTPAARCPALSVYRVCQLLYAPVIQHDDGGCVYPSLPPSPPSPSPRVTFSLSSSTLSRSLSML